MRDEEWFFDTELLVVAERRGMRIHEVPVDWVEDPDSRVDIVSTAVADLRGVERLAVESEVVRFAAVGIASTIAYALLYVALHGPLTTDAANAIALALAAMANIVANDRLTFSIRGRVGVLREHLLSGLAFVLAFVVTSGSLDELGDIVKRPPVLLQVAVLVIVSAVAILSRWIGLRRRELASPPRSQSTQGGLGAPA